MGEFEEDWISLAVSAINTIKSVTLSPEAKVSEKWTVSGYSGRAVKPIALRFILEMAQNPIVNRQPHENEGKLTQSLPACVTRLPKNESIEFSGIGGIETWRDALEFMQLGCRNVPVGLPVGRYRAGEKDWKIETFTALPCRTPKYRCGRCGR